MSFSRMTKKLKKILRTVAKMVLTKKLESYGDCRNKGIGLEKRKFVVLRTVTSVVGEIPVLKWQLVSLTVI